MGSDNGVLKAGLEYIVADSLCKQLERSVEEKYPAEACGILLGKRFEDIIVITNCIFLENNTAASMQDSHFSIDPLKLYEYEKTCADDGNEIIGFYHSHPDAKAFLSHEDKKYMIPEQLYLIFEVKDGKTLHRNVWKKSIEDNSIERIKIKVKGE